MKKDNVILVGMPGCGKSTLGVLLAKNLAYDFLDSDLLIQQKAGKKLQNILNEDGIEVFGKLENEVNSSLQIHRTVLATGGSAVYWPESMAHLKEIGTVLYL
ncbi:MAG TPA: shikimate kinase, partial [Clostridiales bacterium]|nr:shikimate kinase [Clostridiales bacterium]